MISISCPICSGPLELRASQTTSASALRVTTTASSQAAEEEVARALQAALRALEDQAAGARWRLSEPDPPPTLAAQLEELQHQIELLHTLIRGRGRPVHTNH